VSDGTIYLLFHYFGGTDPNWVINGIKIMCIEKEYCAPVAEANSLWWMDKALGLGIFENPQGGEGYIGGDINGDGVADILDLVQDLAIKMKTNQGHTGTTVQDQQAGIDAFLEEYNLTNRLYEHTVYDDQYQTCQEYFTYLEDEVKRSQDVKLDLGFWHVEDVIYDEGPPPTWTVIWKRKGGHAVTVAGVDSENMLFAISDPDNDRAEAGLNPGFVRTPPGATHPYPHEPALHNDENYASHDIYKVVPSPSPGGKCGLLNYPFKWNFPENEWETVIQDWGSTRPPVEYCQTFTEIEAAVIVSPPVCGNNILEPGEECDDGNTTSEDGCSATCQWEVVVVKPNGGDVIPSGSDYKIEWLTLSGCPAVKFDLKYSLNNGTSWKTIATDVAGSSYNWTVPKPNANKKNCLVKVIGKDASGVIVDDDKSDSKFTIEVVKVTSPNGGEVWEVGSTYQITWTTNGTIRPVNKVKLFYTYNGGATWILIYTLNGNPGTYRWRIPSANSANCKVKVVLKDVNNKTIGTDMSDAPFSIVH
ncbi:MAG: myxococcus cysteine-rich repeat containing protein, partial [Thermodesulfovibrionales bacterium]